MSHDLSIYSRHITPTQVNITSKLSSKLSATVNTIVSFNTYFCAVSVLCVFARCVRVCWCLKFAHVFRPLTSDGHVSSLLCRRTNGESESGRSRENHLIGREWRTWSALERWASASPLICCSVQQKWGRSTWKVERIILWCTIFSPSLLFSKVIITWWCNKCI